MQTTSVSSTSSRPPLRRLSGPIGGVSAGIARTLRIDANLARVGVAGALLLLGPVALISYLLAWLIIPVDESVPASARPSSAPPILILVLALIIGIGTAFDLLFSFPVSWLILASLAAWFFWKKNR